ncbi:sensor histidine kinase [Rhodanobacter spathiphylli]|uniref:histidine kinase n=1 Tax=Rhodanobacter spathiphylli B39 TaxID=1163407 RepID=I4W168_9GAMM|nr:sensor histidine kinase KdpD [Rhodanobacter spathiphylli]EIL93209.1 putative two-component sensor histidine kinase potassium transport regulator protein [Rhodanobacter spathiphylli B39]
MTEPSREARADALLSTAQEERQHRLKIFLGAAPGVGKTYAMLSAARELKRQGVDVVVGLVETHGRAETAALMEGMEVLPRRALKYNDRDFTDFDLDAALARRPAVLLVDELAHRNLPGARHERRWQDIAELLDAGIEVYTALNVQHLESLNDQVRRITGITVRETVPDAFLDRARDIVLVDLPPRELIGRLKQGKVYVPETAAAALNAFFSPTNLAALRELALETIAGHVDSDLREHMLARGSAMTVRRRVLAAIDGHGQSDYLVRVARRIAERRGAPWSVAWVDTGARLEPARRERLDAAMRLARRLGGEAIILRGHAIADELLAHADREGVGQIILGRTRERPLARMLGISLTQRLLRRGAHMELTIIATPVERAKARRRLRLPRERGSRGEYLYATLATLVAFGLAFVADRYLAVANLSLIFLTAVLAVAVRTRMAVAVYAAMLCFLGYNFFFAAPRYTLAIANVDDVLAVTLFLVAALLCSRLATRLASQVESLRAAHAHARALLTLGQQLTSSTDASGIREAGCKALAHALQGEAVILARDAGQVLRVVASAPPQGELSPQDLAAADWSDRHGEQAGRYTDTLNGAPCWMLPLGSEARPLGVAGLRFAPAGGEPDPERRSLALAMAQDIGQALERARLSDELEGARVQGETERLRSALLSSVSHDLRSPLASMIGAAGTLISYEQKLPAEDRRALLDAILAEGQRLDSYIQNLLDMTRLGHGTLKLNRDWTDSAEIVAAAVTRLRKLFPDLHVEILMPAGPVLLHVHAALIEQALFNILENAARFSPAGEVVRVTTRCADGSLLIDVADRGPGIPEDERARIFDMFYSVSRGDRAPQGTGLGLAICRGMIGAHGGSVEALPGDGIGTIIRISLPLPSPPEAEP